MPLRKGRRGRGGGFSDDEDDDGDRQEAAFSANNRHDDEEYDAVEDTKLSRQTGRLTMAGTMFAFGLFGADDPWGAQGESSDDDDRRVDADLPVWGGADDAVDADDTAADGLTAPRTPPAGGTRAGRWGDDLDSDEYGEDVDENRGWTTLAEAGPGALRASRRRGLGGADGAHGAPGGLQWSWDMAGLTADFREGDGLPDGLQLAGAEPEVVEDEDGTSSLLMPADESICLTLSLGYDHGISPWTLEDDGKLHAYTVIIALRLDNLPTTSLPLFNGGPAALTGPNAKPAESVQVYKNGGVGALGQCGTAETAIKPGRYAWVVVTRKPGDLVTYVNGRRCAEVKLESKAKSDGKKVEVNASFAIDPKQCAILPGSTGSGSDSSEREACGVAIKYMAMRTQTWNDDKVREELLKIRNTDEFAEDREDFKEALADHLSLQPLYGKPPPVWLHPTFCAAFCDHAIEGTGLDGVGSAHTSLEFFALVLKRMLANRSLTALFGSSLAHAEWQACNALLLAVDEAKKLALRSRCRTATGACSSPSW